MNAARVSRTANAILADTRVQFRPDKSAGLLSTARRSQSIESFGASSDNRSESIELAEEDNGRRGRAESVSAKGFIFADTFN